MLQRLLAEYPSHQRAWSLAGFLLAEKGRDKEAVDAFEHAVALDPDDGPTQFNLGFLLQKAGRHDRAISCFESAVKLAPSIDRAWYGLGISLIQIGRFREAIEKLQEASRLQPFNPFAHYQLAAAWFKMGEPEQVRKQYRHVKGFDPTVAEHIRQDFGVPKDSY